MADKWDEVIVDAPNATLTKQQVHDYYANPKVQGQLLDAVKGRATIIRQSFDPNRVVLGDAMAAYHRGEIGLGTPVSFKGGTKRHGQQAPRISPTPYTLERSD